MIERVKELLDLQNRGPVDPEVSARVAALTWCEEVGLARILERVNELVAYAEREWVARGHRVTSPTTNDDRSGVLVIELPESTDGWTMYDALRLHEATYTSPVDGPRDLRVALHFFNTGEEIDATFDTIERLATL